MSSKPPLNWEISPRTLEKDERRTSRLADAGSNEGGPEEQTVMLVHNKAKYAQMTFPSQAEPRP